MNSKFPIIRIVYALLLLGGFSELLLSWPGRLSAQKTPTILVINSDASVQKYLDAHDAFQEAVARPVIEIKLNEPKWKQTEIEDVFYDENPDVIYAIGSKAYAVANKLAGSKPVVFSSIANWRRLPLTDKTYGVSNELHVGMELTLFRYIFPKITTFGVVYSKTYEDWFKTAQHEAKGIGMTLLGEKISKKQQVIPALQKLLTQTQAIWLISDPDVMSSKDELLSILTECEAKNIPVFSYHESFADFGAVLIASVDDPTIGRQAAGLVTEILAGTTLNAEERVQYPAGSRIVLNLKQVKAYGLPLNEDALGSVTEIIE